MKRQHTAATATEDRRTAGVARGLRLRRDHWEQTERGRKLRVTAGIVAGVYGVERYGPLALLLTTVALAGASLAAARTLHVAANGDDSAPGSATVPLRTIQRAADLAQPGDTVLVAPGIYRERVAPPRGGTAGQPITFRSQTPHGAIVRGSDVWRPQWRREAAGIWSGELADQLFTDTAHRDGANPFAIAVSSTPGGRDGRPEHERGYPNSDPSLIYSIGQVFVDGELFTQMPRAGEMQAAARSWHYDAATRRLAVHLGDADPARHEVEITTRRRLFAPHRRQLGYLTVEGFVFERCGNQYPTNFWEVAHPEWQQAGAVGTRSGHHWIIRGNVIRWVNGIGLDLGNEGNADVDLETGSNGRAANAGHHLVEDNRIVDNGAGGTASYSGTHLTIRRNVVARNNRLRFTGKKRWESGGIKLHAPAHSVIEYNVVHDNFGKWGIWLDQGAGEGTRVVGNLVFHQGIGLDFEIGSARPALVANNILIENDIGLGARESGGLTIVHNLVLGSRQAGVAFSIDRTRGGGWSAAHNHVFNNLFIGGEGLFQELTPPDELRSEDRRLDYNVYAMAAGERRLALAKQPPLTLEQWRARWRAYNGDHDAEAHSRAVPGGRYRFDPVTLDLELAVEFDPAGVGTQPEPRLTADFFGRALPADRRVPGPFQDLRAGVTRHRLALPLAPTASGPEE